MHIKLHKVDTDWSGSKYTLTIPSKVKVWTSGNRSGAVSSGTTQTNGATDTYTGYIKSSDYDSISLGDVHRTDKAYFVVRVTTTETGGPVESSNLDPQAAMDAFCDDFIFAVEPGIPGVHPGGEREYEIDITTSDQQAVHKPGVRAMYHHKRVWVTGHGPTLPNGCCQASGALPGEAWLHDHEPCTVPPIFECESPGCGWYLFFDECDQNVDEGASQLTLYTRLYSTGGSHRVNNAFKNRIYGYRRGGYFFVSYGGKVLGSGILSSGEYAMDLAKVSSDGDYELFSDGSYRFTNDVDDSGGIGIGGVTAGLFTVACALTAPVSTPWAVVFGTAAGIAGIIEAVDTETGTEGRAHGAMYVVVSKSAPWTSTTWESFVDDEHYSGNGDDGGPYAINPGLPFNAQAGNQFTIFLEAESVCSQIAYLIINTEASSKVEVKTGTAEDWKTLSLAISE